MFSPPLHEGSADRVSGVGEHGDHRIGAQWAITRDPDPPLKGVVSTATQQQHMCTIIGT